MCTVEHSIRLQLQKKKKTLLSGMISSCFHKAPPSWYSDGLLRRMWTAKCCYGAGGKRHAEARWGMKATHHECHQLPMITTIFCATFALSDLWFPPVWGYGERRAIASVCSPSVARPSWVGLDIKVGATYCLNFSFVFAIFWFMTCFFFFF